MQQADNPRDKFKNFAVQCGEVFTQPVFDKKHGTKPRLTFMLRNESSRFLGGGVNYHNITVRGDLAIQFHEKLKKGDLVKVTGPLFSKPIRNTDGTPTNAGTIELNAKTIEPINI